jgi:ATP-dependent Clp protease ATP-binding subunit ClpB
VRRKPYSVVLLDEIEKAHPDVFNILLQVLDDGRLTDNKGRVVNFRNTIIIMTSNMGSQMIQENLKNISEGNRETVMEQTRRQVMDLLRKTIRPEFLNRVDEIIMFTPLTHDEIREIVRLQIDRIREMLKEKDIDIVLDDEALEWIANVGFDPVYGARPIKRVIQRELVNELSKELIAGTIDKNTVIRVSVENDHLVFSNEQ